MTGPMKRNDLSVFLLTRSIDVLRRDGTIDSGRRDVVGLTRQCWATLLPLTRVMRDKDCYIPRDLVPGVVGDFHLDRVSPSFPRAGAFGAQIDCQVAGDPAIRRRIAVAMTINGF